MAAPSLLLLAVLALCSAWACAGLRVEGPGRRPCSAREGAISGSVVVKGGSYKFVPGQQGGAAWGHFLDSDYTPSNFGQLVINTGKAYSDEEQVYAAGYLEGVLTAPRIYDNFQNMQIYFTTPAGMNVSFDEPMQWIEQQDRWVRDECARRQRAGELWGQAEGAEGEDGCGEEEGGGGGGGARVCSRRYWQSVCLLLRQFDGMVAGYQAQFEAAKDKNNVGRMSYRDFLFLHSNADLYDIIDALDPSQGPTWAVSSGASPSSGEHAGSYRATRHAAFLEEARRNPEMAAAKLFSDVATSGRCSALVKLAADLSDIWMGHSTWDTYTAALRIFKHYRFALRTLRPAANSMSFSSYPGELFSDDDFFLLSSKLVVLQTTNKIFNPELFDALDPATLLSWQRVRTANWLARGGEEWAAHLRYRNSGTYNNQYLVVDLKKFKPKVEANDGLLWVVEQIPGLVVAADMTPTLCMGYFPSMNIPFFPEVYNRSGYPDFISKVEKYGQHFTKTTHWLSYQNSPRSKIFRRDQSTVGDLAGMKRVMRYNDWRNDPFSEGSPLCAVCGRGDLDPKAPVARGCYDTKVTSYKMALALEAEAVNGPTVDRGQLPPFDWSRRFPGLSHRGQPKRFAFEFERMSAAAVEEAAAAAGAGCHGGAGGDGELLQAQ